MATKTKRSTIYLDPNLHKALKFKAAETDCSLSELVNDAVRRSLSEDAQDLTAFRERELEPNLSFEEALKDMRRCGRL